MSHQYPELDLSTLGVGTTVHGLYWSGTRHTYHRYNVKRISATGQVTVERKWRRSTKPDAPVYTTTLRFMPDGREIGRTRYSRHGHTLVTKEEWDGRQRRDVEIKIELREKAAAAADTLASVIRDPEATYKQRDAAMETVRQRLRDVR